jgi:hypothetical protein
MYGLLLGSYCWSTSVLYSNTLSSAVPDKSSAKALSNLRASTRCKHLWNDNSVLHLHSVRVVRTTTSLLAYAKALHAANT